MLVGSVLIVIGLGAVALGFIRAREPWRRYRDLQAQDENAARYRAWRGGPASDADEKTGASVAMELLRRRARTWGAVAAAGVVLVVAGILLAAG